jgi:putative flippase GtrA
MKRKDLSIIVAMMALLFALFSIILMLIDGRTLPRDLIAFFISMGIALIAMYIMEKQSLQR